jgi:hypothetical protein
MITRKIVYACLLALMLCSTGSGSFAQGNTLPILQTTSTGLNPTIAFTPFFLYTDYLSGSPPMVQSHILVDKSGGMHAVYNTSTSIYYAYCPSKCGASSSWTTLTISPSSTHAADEYPTLALDTQNHPRILWFWGENNDYVYAECNSNCTALTGWSITHIAVTDTSTNYPVDKLYFALDNHDHPRFVTSWSLGFQYLTCDTACTVSANWLENDITIATTAQPSGAMIDALKLVFNATDQPRIIGLYGNYLVYIECASLCDTSSSWNGVIFPDAVGGFSFNQPSYSLRLDSMGRPRVAYFSTATADTSLHYAWSNADSSLFAGWTFTSIVLPRLPVDSVRSVDLAIDSHDQPSVAYVRRPLSSLATEGLEYAQCTSSCESAQPNWVSQTIETSADLNLAYPIPLCATNCISDAWSIDGYVSLALNKSDQPGFTYFVRHMQLYKDPQGKITTPTDISTIRLATAGSPRYYTYLPSINAH